MADGARTGGRTIALEGASGVGKSTVARRLAEARGAVLIDEAFDRVEPRPALAARDVRWAREVEGRLLREELRRYAEAERARRRGAEVVLDTAFFGPVSYTAGLVRERPELAPALRVLLLRARRAIAGGRLGLPDLTVYLDLDPRATARRVAGDPRVHPPTLAGQHALVGRYERAVWRSSVRPILGDRMIVLAATGPATGVARRAARAIDRFPRRGPAGPGPADRVLVAFAGLPPSPAPAKR